MKEFWLKNKKLIPKKEWIKQINNLKTRSIVKNKEEAKKTVKELLIKAIKKRLPAKRLGIFFSGGVDSSLISAVCQELKQDFICYTVGFQEGTKEPEDITEAKKVAKSLGLKLNYRLYNLKEAEKIITETAKALKPANKIDVVNIGVGSVILAAARLAQKDKITCFFSGLGSEEIFAGYERHSQAKKVNQECWSGLKQMWERDLVREETLGQKLKITVKTPFLDKRLINYVMKLPAEWKINQEQKKVILREVAEDYLGPFAWRKKKAAQYGSCFDKAISKLTKKEGFKFKKDYLKKIK